VDWHNPICCQTEGLLQLLTLNNIAEEAAWRPQSTGKSFSGQTPLLVGRGLVAPPQEPYAHYRPFGPQSSVLQATDGKSLLTPLLFIGNSHTDHTTLKSDNSHNSTNARQKCYWLTVRKRKWKQWHPWKFSIWNRYIYCWPTKKIMISMTSRITFTRISYKMLINQLSFGL